MECFYYIKKMLPASGIELALNFPPVRALLNGGGVPVICSAPVSECWPELGVKSRAVLRRATVRRRCRLCARLSSGEESPTGVGLAQNIRRCMNLPRPSKSPR